MNEFIESITQSYNWQAALISLVGIVLIVKIGKYIAFLVPALAQARKINLAEDAKKIAKPKYLPVIKSSEKIGVVSNIAFFVAVLPFVATLVSQPAWMIGLHVFAIIMVYDFFYYFCHRFWFHGQGKMRQIHAIHHQARNPTHIDAYYVHPTETFIGIMLYMCSIPLLAAFLGPFHVSTIILSFVIFTQVNTLNHTLVELPYFPFKTLNWFTAKHHVHHENMHKGNYASITPLYDKLFGTLD
jgi:sterol desaturase/sphingolipid hydroxylase (fatty acid hydroxylase superfamily)